MQPASPFVVSPARGASSIALRGAFAMLLALLLAAVVDAQPTADAACRRAVTYTYTYTTVPVAAQPTKKEPDKKDPEKKEPEKKEYTWPKDINGKDIKAIMKDLEDPDPALREFAARALPNFGPPAQKADVSALLVKRLTAEKDPGVKFAVYRAIGSIEFENDAHNHDALRILAEVIDVAPPGGSSRYNAVLAVSMFGPRGYETISRLTGVAASDPSYETRRAIASALGRVGFSETTGPNRKALTSLADHFAKDTSAVVRMEALQSLMLLGPPWAEVVKKVGPKDPPVDPKAPKAPPTFDTKAAEVVVRYLKVRVGDPKTKTVGLEKDKHVEIWARLVLMRFDPKEMNDDNLDVFALYLGQPDMGVKAQALQAIAMMGEAAGKKLDAVVRLLLDKTQPIQLTAATIQTLTAMGPAAKPAIKDLKQLAIDTKKDADKIVEMKKPGEKLTAEELYKKQNAEELVKMIEAAIKQIDDAKSVLPVDPKKSTDPKKP